MALFKRLKTFRQQRTHMELCLVHYSQSKIRIIDKITKSDVELQVIKAGEWSGSHSILISNNNDRFLFNCGEGITRDLLLCKGSMQNIKAILVTKKKWANISGLLGLMIAKSSFGKETNVDIIGPPNCDGVIHSDRSFSLDINVGLNVVDVHHTYTKHGLKITPLLIHTSSSHKGQAMQTAVKLHSEDYSLCYICKSEMRDAPVILVVDCPNRRYLNSVVSNSELLKYQKSDQNVVVIHLTPYTITENEEYVSWIDKFGENTRHLLVNERSIPEMCEQVIVQQVQNNIIDEHIFPLFPFSGQEYEQSTKLERNRTVHAERNRVLGLNMVAHHVDGTGRNRLLYSRSQVEQLRSSMCEDTLLIDVVQKTKLQIRNDQEKMDQELEESRVIVVTGLNTYTAKKDILRQFPNAINVDLQSKAQNDYRTTSHAASVTFRSSEDALQVYKRYLSGHVFKILGQSVKLEKLGAGFEGETYPEVIFLGTGTSNPSTVQNQAAILVHCSANKCILLDCGADTWSQMCKLYGSAQAKDVLRKVTAVFISHLHIDHHSGLVNILQERVRILKADGVRQPKRITIFCSKPFSHWLHAISVMGFLDPSTYDVAAAEDMQRGIPTMSKITRDQLGIKKLKLVGVEHKQFPLGICLKFENDFSLVYSGDTRPSDNLVRAGDKCDLLIHEATYPDHLVDKAIRNQHSCTTEAINTGIAMRAGHTILTHLGYANSIPESIQYPQNSNVSYALDFMRVRPCDLKKLSHISKAVFHLRKTSQHKIQEAVSKV